MEGSGGGMGKKLRLRFSRVLPSFNSRRSNVNPNPNPNPREIDFAPPPPPSASLRLAPVVSTGCCCAPRRLSGRRSDADLSHARETPTYLWRKEASALPTLQNQLDSDNSSIFFPPPQGNPRRRRDPEARRRRSGCAAGAVSGKKKKPSRSFRSRTRNSTSSGDSGWFSSEDDEREGGGAGGAAGASEDDGDETDTLLSSFEADSSGVIKAGAAVAACCPSPETGSPEAGPEKVLRRMASGPADVMVTESFAVVKQSEDPHGDFRRSMAEMVLEKQIYDAAGLEQLLHCFLTINSRHHHQAIVAAFADIWDAIFPKSTSKDA